MDGAAMEAMAIMAIMAAGIMAIIASGDDR